jgi:hypothetical protein
MPSPDLTPALDQLLTQGLLWREHESDRRAYNALVRWREVAAAQLHSKGWVLVHHESLQTFQAVNRKGKHHRHLNRNTALCLFVLRLLRAETPVGLTPHPVITLSALSLRCADFNIQPDLSAALPELVHLKLIQPAGGRLLRPTQPDQLIELLPTLEVAIPDSAIQTLAEQLKPNSSPTASNPHQPFF